jgi:hypothetical protein
MDKVHKPSNSECYTQSSEPFRFYTELSVPNIVYSGYEGAQDADNFACVACLKAIALQGQSATAAG